MRHGGHRKMDKAAAQHAAAVRHWNDKAKLAEAGATTADAMLAQTRPTPAVPTPAGNPAGFEDLLMARVMVETRGSFRDLTLWTKAASAAASAGGKAKGIERQDSKQLVDTLAHYERGITFKCLEAGSAFRLAADGKGRCYQVEIGALLWKWPAGLKFLLELGPAGGLDRWVETLGPQGPWLVSRLIGARELPGEMDAAGKIDAVVDSVRRATTRPSGEVDGRVHRHVTENTRSWASDGADRKVGDGATEAFPNMKYRVWEESHSATKLLQHSLTGSEPLDFLDKLLVSQKEPPSLAKFLQTSDVFSHRFGQASLKAAVAWCLNFCWALQRFASRARPLGREARRWDPIIDALAAEAGSANAKRKGAARHLLKELGNEHSDRILVAGMYADAAVEHYVWVAGGDERNPDSTTATDRGQLFLDRLDVLFTEGTVLGMRDTFTGEALEFLKTNKSVQYAGHVVTFGLGEPDGERFQTAVTGALRTMQELVANMKEYMAVYRNPTGWLNKFAAMALPSPLTAQRGTAFAAVAKQEQIAKKADECLANLETIRAAASVGPDAVNKLGPDAVKELRRILPRAEWHAARGCNARQAWGRASMEFPELTEARVMVEAFLIFKSSTGDVERRFRVYTEQNTSERAQLLDVTVEALLCCEQAPPSAALREGISNGVGAPAHTYLTKLCKLHHLRDPRLRRPNRHKSRRDAGCERGEADANEKRERRGEPISESAFNRKRARAIEDVMQMSPDTRKRMRLRGEFGAAPVPRDVAASAKVIKTARERAAEVAEKDLAADQCAEAEREKKRRKPTKAAVRTTPLVSGPSAPAGAALVRPADTVALKRAKTRGFRIYHDPDEFAKAVLKKRARAPKCGHLVVTPQEATDFSIAARLAAALLGTYRADPHDYAHKGPDCGVQFRSKWDAKGTPFLVAVSASSQQRLPSVVPLIRLLAAAPDSKLELWDAVRLVDHYSKVAKKVKKNKASKVSLRNHRILGTKGDLKRVGPKFVQLLATPDDFLRFFETAVVGHSCPGFPQPKDEKDERE